MQPGAVALGLGVVAALVLLNFSALILGAEHPWLPATDLVSDLAVLGVGAYAIVRLGLASEARNQRMQAAVDEAQSRLSGVIDTAMDAILTLDANHRIVVFNRAAEQVFGVPREAAIGTTLDRFLPSRYRATHRGHIEDFGRTHATSRKMGAQTVLWALRADGSEFPIEASISQTGEGERHLFTVILRDITRRKEFEDALQRQQDELRELSARVLEAREEEKTLIARNLHDELGQLLTALKMDLAWLRERLPGGTPELGERAGRMNAVLDQTVASVRRISAELRPLMLDDLGLADAAGWLVEDFGTRAGIACSVEMAADAELASVGKPAATAVYRVLQESLTNIARHANAKNAWIVLGIERGEVRLDVEDDGKGIDPDTLARSLGLKGMRERALYLGGTLEVSRAPRGGTRVQLRVPAAPEAPA
ncbi:MAG TPA: PAS domain-containing sensor histidine kinase [Burkholderiales bacterium]